MTCLRCEVVRAKIIANGMAGLRKTGEQILAELQGRYGDVYFREGNKIMRNSPAGDLFIIEVRK